MKNHFFNGQVAIVTGAGRGLGREYAKALARHGASVMVSDLEHDGVAAARIVEKELLSEGHDATSYTGSVAVETSAVELVERTIEKFGRVDILINNAGNNIPGTSYGMTTADFNSVLSVHLMGTFWVQKAALQSMRKNGYGRIINAASALGSFGRDNAVAYVTAKAAIIGLTKAAALENGDKNIKVNSLNPIAYTPMNHKYHDSMKRFTPDQLDVSLVAPAVLALAHRDCPFSGEVISAGLGRVARVFTATTQGFRDRNLSTDLLFENIEKIFDESDYVVLRSSNEQYDRIFN